MNSKLTFEDEVYVSTELVYVLQYSHRHGVDVSTYRTEDGAIQAIYEIVMGCLDEVDNAEKRKEIREAVKSRSLAKLSQLWAEETEEGFDIDETPVCEDDPNDAAALDALIKASEEADVENNETTSDMNSHVTPDSASEFCSDP